MASNSSVFVPTASETVLILAVIKTMVGEGRLQCNWTTVAKHSGHSNADTANVRWNQIRRRIAQRGQSVSAESPASAARVVKQRPQIRGKRKPKREALDDEAGDEAYGERPRRKVKKSKRALAAAQAAELLEPEAKVEDGDE